MRNFKVATIILWTICLFLNTLSLLGFANFGGKETAIIWFFISILTCIFIYDKIYNKILSRVLISLVAFFGGFFTYFLYYGFYDLNSIYMGVISLIITFSLSLGVGVLV